MVKYLSYPTNLPFPNKIVVGAIGDREKIFGIHETGERREIEINFESVVGWALVFTNAFFVSYFFARLFHWI